MGLNSGHIHITIVSLIKTLCPHYSVLVGSRNGLDHGKINRNDIFHYSETKSKLVPKYKSFQIYYMYLCLTQLNIKASKKHNETLVAADSN